MNTTDKKGVLRNLVEKGKEKGNLSNQEILDALTEINFSPEQLEKFYDKLEENGIEIVEDNVGDESLEELSSAAEGQPYDGSYIDDPVKMYLREIGKIQMLTPEEEQDIARRISEGDVAAKKRIGGKNSYVCIRCCFLKPIPDIIGISEIVPASQNLLRRRFNIPAYCLHCIRCLLI